jgi:ubiquinone/menaquinone biosynthesis C-methylase UbiE
MHEEGEMTDEQLSEQEHKERVRAQFGATAQDYVDSARHRAGRDLDRLVELAEGKQSERALDIATGGGHTALAIAPTVEHVVASDLTPKMLAAAEQFITGQGVNNVSFEIAEAEHLPFDDEAFDIVTCRIAPHHFADVQAFCREVARVLRPGGRFVLMDSTVPDDDELDAFINEVEWRRDKTHVRSYRISEWTAWIEATGLTVDAVEPVERTFEWDSWTARSRMDPTERDELEAFMLNAPAHVREYFKVVSEDGRMLSFGDYKHLVRARKA